MIHEQSEASSMTSSPSPKSRRSSSSYSSCQDWGRASLKASGRRGKLPMRRFVDSFECDKEEAPKQQPACERKMQIVCGDEMVCALTQITVDDAYITPPARGIENLEKSHAGWFEAPKKSKERRRRPMRRSEINDISMKFDFISVQGPSQSHHTWSYGTSPGAQKDYSANDSDEFEFEFSDNDEVYSPHAKKVSQFDYHTITPSRKKSSSYAMRDSAEYVLTPLKQSSSAVSEIAAAAAFTPVKISSYATSSAFTPVKSSAEGRRGRGGGGDKKTSSFKSPWEEEKRCSRRQGIESNRKEEGGEEEISTRTPRRTLPKVSLQDDCFVFTPQQQQQQQQQPQSSLLGSLHKQPQWQSAEKTFQTNQNTASRFSASTSAFPLTTATRRLSFPESILKFR